MGWAWVTCRQTLFSWGKDKKTEVCFAEVDFLFTLNTLSSCTTKVTSSHKWLSQQSPYFFSSRTGWVSCPSNFQIILLWEIIPVLQYLSPPFPTAPNLRHTEMHKAIGHSLSVMQRKWVCGGLQSSILPLVQWKRQAVWDVHHTPAFCLCPS